MQRADFQAVLDALIRAQVTAQHAYWPRHLTPGERQVRASEVLIGVPDGTEFCAPDPNERHDALRLWLPRLRDPRAQPRKPYEVGPESPVAPLARWLSVYGRGRAGWRGG